MGLLYRYQQVKMWPPGMTVGYDLSPAQGSWSLLRLEGDLGDAWRPHEDPRDVYFYMEPQADMAGARARWYDLNRQVIGLFGELETGAAFCTLLAQDEGRIYLGGLVTTGVHGVRGQVAPPSWWDCPWPQPVYPSVYEHLLV